MCDICLQTPCLTRCPNAEPVLICEYCWGGIFEGDGYSDTSKIVCFNCLENWSIFDIAEYFNGEIKEAKNEM